LRISTDSVRILRCCSGWKGLGTWNTGLGGRTAAHTNLLRHLVKLGLDPSETPTLEEWPEEISPIPEGYYDMDDDSFFIDWISEGLKVSPGKSMIINFEVMLLTHS
jgi:hypothetical protein